VIVVEERGKRSGMMCAACMLDSELIRELMPVEKYILPIRYALPYLGST